ncbi:hypothetical protein SKAU_G00076540 [Synaphobranchus kaupii]|uniref:SH3 domain-containing protein n=1 Tax=Synaphobranchus kaupii TaxID=118154 RepID=A0A9Q1G7T1_SYNKA|nr:hypothetical protein SKAU_G00076540 [Synaphobranchus kaupii]
MSQRMKEMAEKMTKEISSLSDTIRALKQGMKADNIPFLQNYKATKRRAQYNVSDPEEVKGGRIDVIKHLDNLKYRVWEKMEEIAQHSYSIVWKSADSETAIVNVVPPGSNSARKATSMFFSADAQLKTQESGTTDKELYSTIREAACNNKELPQVRRGSEPKHCWNKPAALNPEPKHRWNKPAALNLEPKRLALLQLLRSGLRGRPKEEKPAKLAIRARVVYDYQAGDDTEISLNHDDIITGISIIGPGWWQGYSSDGRFGMFPANCVKLI